MDRPEFIEQSKSSSASYTSHEIQEELLKIIANQIRKKLLPNPSAYYAIIIDETSDISRKEQVSFCLRWVDEDLQIHEHFLGFYEAESTTGSELFHLTTKIHKELNLNFKNLIGQSFDGAANMSGKFQGLATRIKEVAPKAIYIHCYAHRLNLAVEASCSHFVVVRDTLYIAQSLYKFIEGSTKRHGQFQNMLDKESNIRVLKKLCETRWSCRHSSLRALCANYSVIVEFLKVIFLLAFTDDNLFI